VVALKDRKISLRVERRDNFVNKEFLYAFHKEAGISLDKIKYSNSNHRFSHSISMINLAKILK